MLSTSVYATDVGVELEGVDIVFTESSGSPFIDENNRVLVPFRLVLEAIGANVRWESQSRIAVGVKDGVEVAVPIGQTYILKNNEKVLNDTYARIVDGRTYLPIRVVMEAFGYDVGWDGLNKNVLITNETIDDEPIIEKKEVEKKVNTIGNSNGNLYNGGIIVEEKSVIYYVNFSDGEKIYSYNTLNDTHTKLTDRKARKLNVKDDTIYFLEWSAFGHWDAYEMSIDGSGVEQLGESGVNYIKAVGKGVYYYNEVAKTLYFREYDDKYSEKVIEATYENIQIVGDNLYHIKKDEDNPDASNVKSTVVRVNLENLHKEKVFEERIGDVENCMVITENYIFYCKYDDAYALHRVDINGANDVKISSDRIYNLNVDEEYVYYLNPYFDKGIVRIDHEGESKTKILKGWDLNEYSSPMINHLNGDVYFIKSYDGGKASLYKVNESKGKTIRIEVPTDFLD